MRANQAHLSVCLGLSLALLALTARIAWAQNRLGAGDLAGAPGQVVSVPISATTTTPLTAIDAVVEFDADLCAAIAAVEVLPAGRTVLDPAARTVTDAAEISSCPAAGCIRVIFDDFRGAPVIAAGSGQVAKLRLSLRPQAVAGNFPLNLRVQQARNGPARVPVETEAGMLSIRALSELCPGDCNGDGEVTPHELLVGLNIALGHEDVASCVAFDRNLHAEASVDELLLAVGSGISSCPPGTTQAAHQGARRGQE